MVEWFGGCSAAEFRIVCVAPCDVTRADRGAAVVLCGYFLVDHDALAKIDLAYRYRTYDFQFCAAYLALYAHVGFGLGGCWSCYAQNRIVL